jgi:hypothetical protein
MEMVSNGVGEFFKEIKEFLTNFASIAIKK